MTKNRMKLVKQMLAVVLCLAMVLGSLSLTGEIVLAEGTNACNGDHTPEMYGEDGKCKDCQAQAPVSVTIEDETVVVPTIKYYPTFAEAITEAVNHTGCTVTLLDDITIDSTQSISGGTFTLDLGEYTLKSTADVGYTLSVTNAKMTITSGEKGCIEGDTGIYIGRGATVDIQGGKISAESPGIYMYDGGNLKISNATVVASGAYASGISAMSGSITIGEGASILGTLYGVDINNTNFEMSGGEIKGSTTIIYSIYNYDYLTTNVDTFLITGGTFQGTSYVFSDNMSGGSEKHPVLEGGIFPNGINVNDNACELSELLGEKSAYYDADGKLVNIEDGVKTYTGSLTVKQDTDAPNIYYKLSEDETKGKELDDTKVVAISIAKDDAIILEAQDAISGVTEFKYALTASGESAPADESEWIPYTEPIVCSELGEISLHIKAIDAMQNEKSAQMNLVVCAVPVVEEVTYTYKANKDKVIEVTLNQNSIEGIVWQETELEEGTDYILAVDETSDCAKITLKKEWLDTLVAGETTLQMKYKRNNTSAFMTPLFVDIPVTILEAIPNLGTVTADAIDETESISDIVLHRTNTEVAGTLTIDAGQTLAAGTNELSYTFTPTDKNYAVVTGKVKVKVASSYNVELSSEDTTISSTDFSDILKENAARDIVIQSNDKITFTFAKGTMSNVEGKTDYDFGTSICADFASAGTMDENITKDNFVARINFDYSGKLPATASIQIAVGKEYAGERLYYSKLLENGLKYIMSAVVDAEGTILVQQDSCSDYVLTTEKPVEDKDPTGDNNQTGGNNPVSPKTGDGFVAWLISIIGITGCVLYGFQSKSKKIKE